MQKLYLLLNSLILSFSVLGADLYKLNTSNFISNTWTQNADNDYAIIGQTDGVTINYNKTAAYSNFSHNFSSIDLSSFSTLSISIQTNTSFNLRIDLVDKDGNITNATATSNAISSGATKTYTYNFTNKFSQNYPSSSAVDASNINSIMFLPIAGTATGSGSFKITAITLGNPNGTQNTTQPSIDLKNGKFLINQVGYELNGPKKAIFQTSEKLSQAPICYIHNQSNTKLDSFLLVDKGEVEGWKGRYFYEIDFSRFSQSGIYVLKIQGTESYNFEIDQAVLFNNTADKTISFFNSIRNTDVRDHALGFNGNRTGTKDVFGGWSDASGDPGKHMSHLSYANYFNPQQIPWVAYSMMQAQDWNTELLDPSINTKWNNEIDWGIDYIMRQYDETGYFYLAIFDDWGGSSNRQICEWGLEGADNGRSPNYQCAMREGGGVAIASLAKAYRLNRTITKNSTSGGSWTPNQMLDIAQNAYAHLKSVGDNYPTKNLEYCNNHEENIIDEYCGLLAATELFTSTNDSIYLLDARNYANRIMSRLNGDIFFSANENASRAFYHAADEGMPVFALYKLAKIDPNSQTQIFTFMQNWINYYKKITFEVNNPFNYIREKITPYSNSQLGDTKNSFFVPHNNETGYWWQGENARLASMSCAFLIASNINQKDFNLFSDENSSLAVQQLNWILGANPFDVCMMTDVGTKNYPAYLNGAKGPNHPGGICNGITSDVETETNIAFMPYAVTDWQNWRWIEQWLPHDAWYLMAVSYYSHLSQMKNDCNDDLDGLARIDACEKCSAGKTNKEYISNTEDCLFIGLSNKNDNEIKVSINNPVFSELQVNGLENYELRIYNLNGSLKLKNQIDTSHNIDVSTLEEGIYLINLSNENSNYTFKFIKK